MPSAPEAVLMRRAPLLLVVVLCFAPVGCGSGMVQVKGQVTVNGKPLPLGRVSFQPVDLKQGRPAMANVDVDGRFTASTFKVGDGLVPGEYRIAIQGPRGGLPGEGGSNFVKVPARYEDAATSGFTVTVKEGDPTRRIDLKLE
jgi:hypothetical protein